MNAPLGAILLVAGFVSTLAGCADASRNVYEGKRTSDTLMQTPMERATQPVRTHDEYERERNRKSDQY